ncbi:MAG: glycosyltransferase family 4 protein [Verrucomicrobiales bacterium]|nr:glycosyltransferase family 4 protein [Verrucomicrobiales bacterium]
MTRNQKFKLGAKVLVATAEAKTLICHRGSLLKAFRSRGLEITAVAADEDERASSYLEQLGGRYEPVRMSRSGLNPFRDLLTFFDLWRICRRVKPDYYFGYTIKAVIYGVLAARLAGVKRVDVLIPGLGYGFTPDGTFKQWFVERVISFLYWLVLSRANRVYLQNHDDEELLRRRGILSEKTPSSVTLGSGVALGDYKFDGLAGNRRLIEGRLKFVLVSRLLRAKGIGEYVEAARLVKRSHPDWEFDLVGPMDPGPDGVGAGEVEGWVNEGGINYRGETSDVKSFLRGAHVFVLPTYYREGVPKSTLEALSLGRPVVTTDAVGARETVKLTGEGWRQRGAGEAVMEGWNGFLVEPRNGGALADAIERIGASAERVVMFGVEARKLAEERFDVRRVNGMLMRGMGLVGEGVGEGVWSGSEVEGGVERERMRTA